MKKVLLILTLAVVAVGCSSNPHKAKDIETKMERSQKISGDTKLGIKDGNMVVQKKVMMNEELRRIQNEVYAMEDNVYGSRKFKSEGLYGNLKRCKANLSSKKWGGNGKVKWTEPMDRITDKEDDFEVGIDEDQKLVGVSEEFLKDRIKRFRGYKKTLMKREDEYREKVEICDTELESRKHDIEAKKAAASDS